MLQNHVEPDLNRLEGTNGTKHPPEDCFKAGIPSGTPPNETRRHMDDEASPESGAQERTEPALDLNFVPIWARKPPENPYVGREDRPDREERGGDRVRGGRDRFGKRDDRRGGIGRREDRGRGGNRPMGDGRLSGGSLRREGGPARFPEGAGRQGPGDARPPREGDRRRERGDRGALREARPRLDVKVAFLPERERLTLVVRDIQASRRAYPLVEIANRFLGREDLYVVKLEMPTAPEGASRQTFVQCLECKRVFRSRANAESHVLAEHLDKYFSAEEVETEPPSGNYSFVARCGLSGALLGPPNYHGYNERIQEVWSTRFAHMSKAEYLGHVETVRDEALVEQWKDSLRRKTVYRLKEVPEGAAAADMALAEAQEWMRGKVRSMLRESPRCMVPGAQSKKIDDGPLRAAVSSAWQRECRFPLTLLLALRPAFRHMHLHLFKVNAKETYATAVAPTAVDLATAPEIVKEIAVFLDAHPGATRQQVLEGLRPGADPESPEAAEVLKHLTNLMANGGVIEFFNGTLAMARGGAGRQEDADGGSKAGEGAGDGILAEVEDVGEQAGSDASPELPADMSDEGTATGGAAPNTAENASEPADGNLRDPAEISQAGAEQAE